MPARTPAPWTRYRSHDPDEAHGYMRGAYMDLRVHRTRAAPGGFALRTAFAYLGDVAISEAAYSAATRFETLPYEDPCFLHVHAGRYRVARPGEDYRAAAGATLLLTPDSPLDLEVEDFRLGTVTLPRALLAEVAANRTGAQRPVMFESVRPVSAGAERTWVSLLAHVHHAVLSDPQLVANALIVGEVRRLLAAGALSAFANSALRTDEARAGASAPGVVRRAVAFVDEHAEGDVSVSDIAGAARVGVRTLQEAFRRHLGILPLAYLRRVRLDLAHRDLVAARPGADSVVAIARRRGFANAGRFAQAYRAAYGRPPGDTLRA